MESFFATVKKEEADRFPSYSDAKMALFDYIEVFYNQRRRHSSLGRSARQRSSDRERRHDADGGALGGLHVPALNDDGHATEHPSTFSEIRE
jgi:transposase InsO family protein